MKLRVRFSKDSTYNGKLNPLRLDSVLNWNLDYEWLPLVWCLLLGQSCLLQRTELFIYIEIDNYVLAKIINVNISIHLRVCFIMDKSRFQTKAILISRKYYFPC